MSRLHGRLTALAVKAATKRGLYPDGLGLCLQIARNGSRSWICATGSAVAAATAASVPCAT